MDNNDFVKQALGSKFYQEKLAHINTNDWNQIPFTTKEDLRNADVIDLMGADFNHISTYHETSGTTGTPTASWFSRNDIERQIQLLTESELHLTNQDMVLNRLPFAIALPAFLLYWACQRMESGHVAVEKGSSITPYPRVSEVIKRIEPTIFAMSPSEAKMLYKSVTKLGVNVPLPKLRALLVCGELLTPARRNFLQNLWDAPVTSLLGSTETGILYTTCKEGHFHLNRPDIKIEVVDEAGNLLGKNQKGYCVVSTMREGMPLLRYANNDIVEIKEAFTCRCGSEHPILIHYGRSEDRISYHHKTFDMYTLQEAVYSLSEVPMLWKFHSYCGKRIAFEYQPYDGRDYSKQMEQELNNLLGIPIMASLAEFISDETLTVKPNNTLKFKLIDKHK
ncbi:AMP-binding protein (plasmid) [Aneurinibacillus sp. Ricciae_BoGa-3]|uniref:phenylacetate--CoA ligase family protein n=1 Tax=Aneurinibacillus sp. Ricciae_BoGa-3 TaxID=3022697 RepID=UPI0023420031|nr:AMP-binding protein [Aneurinibacillus sp. Ricciae_BoGa-3]WCK57329.1 AMP-binding protein [Aneurinibacillus sp. Ricciae_BoGa-3]